MSITPFAMSLTSASNIQSRPTAALSGNGVLYLSTFRPYYLKAFGRNSRAGCGNVWTPTCVLPLFVSRPRLNTFVCSAIAQLTRDISFLYHLTSQTATIRPTAVTQTYSPQSKG